MCSALARFSKMWVIQLLVNTMFTVALCRSLRNLFVWISSSIFMLTKINGLSTLTVTGGIYRADRYILQCFNQLQKPGYGLFFIFLVLVVYIFYQILPVIEIQPWRETFNNQFPVSQTKRQCVVEFLYKSGWKRLVSYPNSKGKRQAGKLLPIP